MGQPSIRFRSVRPGSAAGKARARIEDEPRALTVDAVGLTAAAGAAGEKPAELGQIGPRARAGRPNHLGDLGRRDAERVSLHAYAEVSDGSGDGRSEIVVEVVRGQPPVSGPDRPIFMALADLRGLGGLEVMERA